MTRRSRSAWRWISLAVPVAGLLSTACVVDDGPHALLIEQTQSPMEGTCASPAEVGEVRLISGVLDVGLNRDYPYRMYPVVTNQLASFRAGGQSKADELNNVTLTGFRVSIEPPPGVASIPWAEGCPGDFDYDVETHLLAPEASVGSIVEAIRYCHVPVLRQQFESGVAGFDPNLSAEVVLRVTLKAKGRHGSDDLRSAPFTFPIRVCVGCLQTGYAEPGFAQYDFPNIPACEALSSNPYPGNACDPGQDGLILCCRDQTSRIICPAVPTAADTTSP